MGPRDYAWRLRQRAEDTVPGKAPSSPPRSGHRTKTDHTLESDMAYETLRYEVKDGVATLVVQLSPPHN